LPLIEESALAEQFKRDKNQYYDSPENDLIAAGNPQAQQPSSLLCPSDGSRGRLYISTAANAYGLEFGKANYVGYVSPIHVVCMRTHPGAFINTIGRLKYCTDGTSKTLMLTEIRTRDNQRDSRGVWAAAWTGGSLIAYDMHTANAGFTGAEPGCGPAGTKTRNMPYVPYPYPSIDCLTPNSQPLGNMDQIHECPPNDTAAARLENMPCLGDNGTWTAVAPRSNHMGGVNAAHIDGSIRWINDDIDQFLMARLVSVNDGQGEKEGLSQN